jgi:hypothetical protein
LQSSTQWGKWRSGFTAKLCIGEPRRRGTIRTAGFAARATDTPQEPNAMPLSRRTLLHSLTATAGAALATKTLSAQQEPRLLVCGDNTVFDARLAGVPSKPRWEDVRTWRAKESKSLPARYADRAFATTDDCKPIDDGKRVLVTSSSNGVAIYDRASRETLFYAMVGNAHSACMLPDGHLVVAASTNPEGNALVVFHRTKPETPLFRTPLYSAHGVVWDQRRGILYALGMDTLEEYRFDPANREAMLRRVHQTPLPSKSGHELSPAPDDGLFVTTGTQALLFDKQQRRFEPHPVLGDLHHVKCISLEPRTGRIAYVRADEGEGVWWTFRLRFLNPEAEIESPGQRIYKVRWG